MKKLFNGLLFYFLINFIFIWDCRADLTDYQAEEVAAFASNLIIESATNHKDDKGFPLIAYSQGKRNEGMKEQLSWFSKDYISVNAINGYKWAFDCASFASYVYHKTFNLQLFYTDSIRPYTVSKFVEDAAANKNFYTVLKNVRLTDIDYSTLKKGDLIIIVGSHIMVYIGNQQIAHVSTSAISKGENLGAEVVNVVSKYGTTRVNVIRVKNGLISPDVKPNTILTWPDNKVVQDLGSPDDKPVITTSIVDTDTYIKKLHVAFSDDKALVGYNITQENVIPSTWKVINNQKTFTIDYEISNNGVYYIYAIDSKDQITKKVIQVNNIDKDKPIINNIFYEYNIDGTFNIQIEAEDVNKITYALDNQNYQESNSFKELAKITHTIYVKDIYNNQTTMTIDLSESALPSISINYDPKYTNKLSLSIALSDKNGLIEYSITNSPQKPTTWSKYTNQFIYPVTANGNYYIWVQNSLNISLFKMVTITNIDLEKPIISKIVVLDESFTGYKIEVIATDNKSGILGYSLDGINYQASNILTNVDSTIKTIYVKDNCDNVTTYNIDLEENNMDIILIVLIIIVFIALIITIVKTFTKKKRF